MHRRKFIRNGLAFGLSAGLISPTKLFADQLKYPDLIVAKGDNISELYSFSIKALGGLEKYNLKGKRILLKPTIQWNATPEEKRNTNPELIRKIIRSCYDAGAWEVYVLDHTVDDWRKCYKNSGIEKATKLAYGKIIPANDIRFYGNVNSNDEFHFHELYHKCDLLINVPKLNLDNRFSISGAIKNLHGLTFENTISDTPKKNIRLASIVKTCKPVLNIIDASLIAEKQNKSDSNCLIIGENTILVDAYASQLLEIRPEEIDYLQEAAKMMKCDLNTDLLKIQYIYLT